AAARGLGAQTSSAVRIRTLAWMSGCWARATPSRMVEEQWMAPRAGMMLGMGRTTRGDSAVVEYEHTRIAERDGKLIYHAEPSGQKPADFAGVTVNDTLVIFENPTHDFPQRVIYRRRGADSLLARVEATANGQTRGVDFPYARVACAM